MIDAPLAYAFSAGMVASVNPCGFVMLPAYLAFFVGKESQDGSSDTDRSVLRALAVGAVVTTSFVAVFGLVGLLFSHVSRSLQEQFPWVTLVIGVVMIGLGIAMLGGWRLDAHLPRLQRGGKDRSLGSMWLFGISYATVSLSCTLPIFLSVTANAFTSSNVVSGVAVYAVYGLGMGAVVVALTVAVALARTSAVNAMRAMSQYVERVSAVLILLAGAYVSWYGWFEIRQQRDATAQDPIVDFAFDVQATVNRWITDGFSPFGLFWVEMTPLRAGVLLFLIIGAAVAFVLWNRREGPATS
ncbi:MAG: cytochrome c biogenesis CcdA family protein [Actinomycetota bacterium]|nr:cytochrome c biogenesis CcdA family protein [Actinomycetota bacterium]